MGRRKSSAKIAKSNKSGEDDIPVEAQAAETDASKSVMVDASENKTLSQSEYEEQTVEETEKENNVVVVVGCSKVNKNTVDAAEDEHIHQQHAAEEVGAGLDKGEGEFDMGLGEAKGERRLDENSDEVSDNVDDNNDFNEAEEELGDYDDNEDNGAELYEDDVEDEDEDDEDYDDDNNEEEENDFQMEEEEEEEEEEEIDEVTKLESNDDTSKEAEENQRNGATQGGNSNEENEERSGGNSEIAKLENNNDTLKEGDENQRTIATQGENAKEENGERVGGSLKKKEKSLMNVKERKKITAGVSGKVGSRHNKRQKNGGDDAMNETDKGNINEDIQYKEGTSEPKVKKLRKSRRKATAEGSEKVASKRDDKVESSRPKKVKSMGMIFMCSSKTKKDCYHYKVLGLPANKKDLVGQIYKGMRLFLYDVDLKLLYGIYKAAGRGGFNIQPRAFNSQFPAQVRFTVLEDCLPLAEEKFKKVIRDNYFTKRKFDCQLTYQQVRDLCKLFVSASKGSNAVGLAARVRTCVSKDKDRSSVRREERRSAIAEKWRYHGGSRSHEREVVPSTLKRQYHEDSRPREREVGAAVKRRYHKDLHTHEREVVASAVKRRYHEDLRTHEREVVASAVDRRYHEDSHNHNHEREVVTTAVPIRLVPAAVATPSYVYDRTLELDGYRQNLLVEHRDPLVHLVPEPHIERPVIYRREPALNPIDPYRGAVATEHLDLRLRDEIGRCDPLYISYRERLEQHRDLPSRDDYVRRCDPYISSYIRSTAEDHNLRVQDELRRQDPYSPRERPAFRDHVYGTRRVTDQYLPANRTGYSSSVAPLPERYSVRSLYRY